MKKNYHDYIIPAVLPEIFNYQYVIGATLKNNGIILEAENKFDLSHVFSINQNCTNGSEFFIFSAHRESKGIENWYINNLQYLNQFCIYFKSSLESLERRVTPVVINESDIFTSESYDASVMIPAIDNSFKFPKKFLLTNEKNEDYITPHELQCLKLIFQGKNALEIANILFRSVRTIETHIQNIKRKLHCSKRSELIQKIIEYKLHYFFIKI